MSLSGAPTLGIDVFPHIFDTIFASAPFSALLNLRATSRALQDRVDTVLVRHVAVDRRASLSAHNAFAVYYGGSYHRVPRAQWFDSPALTRAVRVLDICDAPSPVDHVVELGRRSTFEVDCWCAAVSRKRHQILDELACLLHHVHLVRRWSDRPAQPVRERRIVTFHGADTHLRRFWARSASSATNHVWIFPDHASEHDPFSPASDLPVVVFKAGGTTCSGASTLRAIMMPSRLATSARHSPSTTLLVKLGGTTGLQAVIQSAYHSKASCTLVGAETCPWPTTGDIATHLRATFRAWLELALTAKSEDIGGFLRNRVSFMTTREYETAVGSDTVALEMYCAQPQWVGLGF